MTRELTPNQKRRIRELVEAHHSVTLLARDQQERIDSLRLKRARQESLLADLPHNPQNAEQRAKLTDEIERITAAMLEQKDRTQTQQDEIAPLRILLRRIFEHVDGAAPGVDGMMERAAF